LYMQQFTTYSVISPEGCAAILWHDRSYAQQAAEALKLSAKDLDGFGLLDGIIPEPEGGAHEDLQGAASLMGDVLEKALKELLTEPLSTLLDNRYKRLRAMGVFTEV